MMMPGRKYQAGTVSYRYGFQNQETEKEIWVSAVTYEYRMEDPRLVRFFSVDPLASQYPYNSPYAFAENRLIDGVELEGLEWAPTKDKQGAVTDYSWVGYNNDGSAKSGSVASAFLNKGDFSYRYSSDAKSRSGQINIYSNTAKSTAHGWYNDKSTALNYTIRITGKFVSGMQGGWSYTHSAQAHDPETGASSQEVNIGASNDRSSPSGVKSRDMFGATKLIFGLAPPPTALEPIYPESILVPIAPKGLGLLGKAATSVGKTEVSVYRVFGGSSRVFGESWTFINPKLYGRFYRNLAGLPSWNSGSFLVKGTVKLSEINSFRMALPLHGNIGRFAPEVIIKSAESKVILKAVSVIN